MLFFLITQFLVRARHTMFVDIVLSEITSYLTQQQKLRMRDKRAMRPGSV